MAEIRRDMWVIREGTVRGAGRYYWFSPGGPGEMAKAAWSPSQSDADAFDTWAEAQDEVCNIGAVCRAVKVCGRIIMRTSDSISPSTGAK